ncbi:MAG: alpha/beta hydrolase [Cyanobacteria bacterium REEB67]|nr:alpha/beta hydrolase [Cyanobacteria bacterium REEB67]
MNNLSDTAPSLRLIYGQSSSSSSSGSASASALRRFDPPTQEGLSQVERETIARATKEFFTPLRPGQYVNFAEDLLRSAEQKKLSNGLHATIWQPRSRLAEDPALKSALLVHGWCGYSAQLQHFVQPLLDNGLRVVAIDLWGHGLSPGEHSDCLTFADGILQAQIELGPFQHVIGHSLGAAAIVLACHAGLVLDSAVLISPPSILLVMEYFVAHKGMPAKLLEPMIANGERYVGKSRLEVDTVMLSKRVETPFLLFHDEKDRRCPIVVSEKLAADKSNRKLIKTNGLGHHHIIESADVVEQAVDYIVGKKN